MLYIDEVARAAPDRLAIHMCATGQEITFADLDRASNRAAQAMRRCGIGRGEHVLIVSDNRPEMLELCFAADRAGIYYTTASTHLKAEEISFIARDCGARLIAVSDRLPVIAGSLAKDAGEGVHLIAIGELGAPWEPYADWCGGCPETPIDDPAQGLDMLYSSGTTGRPKGIKWTLPDQPPGQRTMLIDLLCGLFGYDYDTRYLNPAPLYHAAPLRHVMTTLKRGGQAFVMDRFDAEEALRLIALHRITHSQWVPTMFVRMLKLDEAKRASHDVSSLRMALHAAAPCPVHIKRAMMDWWGLILHEYYAGTENNGFCAITPQEWEDHVGSVGRAKLGTLHICDEAGEELGVEKTGEVYFSGGNAFVYHNDAEKTAAARNRHGWTTLGDIGHLDADGFLYLTDRKSFVIISGGVNIYPQEIESHLITHEAVLDAAVIGVANEDLGEEVRGVVELVEGRAPSETLEAELIAYCKKTLSSVKAPKRIDFRDRLPRDPNGKLVKRRLVESYKAQAEEA